MHFTPESITAKKFNKHQIAKFPIITLLLVEDDAGDIELIHKAFARVTVQHKIDVARDGEKAMTYLYQKQEMSKSQPPDLILLDLNLPRKNGHEVLAEIHTDEQLKHIPVVVLTTSDAEQDILHSYLLGANAYVPKPRELRGLTTFVSLLEDFWFTMVKLPNHLKA